MSFRTLIPNLTSKFSNSKKWPHGPFEIFTFTMGTNKSELHNFNKKGHICCKWREDFKSGLKIQIERNLTPFLAKKWSKAGKIQFSVVFFDSNWLSSNVASWGSQGQMRKIETKARKYEMFFYTWYAYRDGWLRTSRQASEDSVMEASAPGSVSVRVWLYSTYCIMHKSTDPSSWPFGVSSPFPDALYCSSLHRRRRRRRRRRRHPTPFEPRK